MGNDILPSQYKSAAGKKMWKGFAAKGSLDKDANTTTLEQLYAGNYPARDEGFWNYVSKSDLQSPLTVTTIPKYKLAIILQSQYRIEHLDELEDLMSQEQRDIVNQYMADPNLSNNIIVMSDGRIIDGNHRALAAALKGVSIQAVDISELNGSKPVNEHIGTDKNKIYDLLISNIGSGPFDGGCVVMAEAIQMKYGGDIVVLVGHAQRNTNEVAQHAAVKIGNILVDFAGAYEPHEFAKQFERNELSHAGGQITGIRPIQDGDLPDAPRNPELAKQIFNLLK
jgi:hypothetical protein